MLDNIARINKEQALPKFILGSAGHIEFDFIEAKKIQINKISQEELRESIDEEWIAIICHPHPVHGGTKDNKVVHTLCRAWRDQGIYCIRFNFRGVGKSEGVFDNGQGEYADLCSVIDFVKNRYGDHQKILLAGFSFGAYIAAKYASMHKIHALVLVAPPVQYIDFVKSEVFESPVLVIQGDADEVISYKLVLAWSEQGLNKPLSNLQIKILSQAGHFFHSRLAELKIIVQEFYNTIE